MRLSACLTAFFACLIIGTGVSTNLDAQQRSPQLKLSMVQPKGPVTGVWISDGNSDVHIDTEGNGFVIGRNPSLTKLRFTDPALIFEKGGVRLQLKGEDGNAVSRPVPLALAKRLLNDMLNAAVKATAPANDQSRNDRTVEELFLSHPSREKATGRVAIQPNPEQRAKCKLCDGEGEIEDFFIRRDVPQPGEQVSQIINCPDCGGSGWITPKAAR